MNFSIMAGLIVYFFVHTYISMCVSVVGCLQNYMAFIERFKLFSLFFFFSSFINLFRFFFLFFFGLCSFFFLISCYFFSRLFDFLLLKSSSNQQFDTETTIPYCWFQINFIQLAESETEHSRSLWFQLLCNGNCSLKLKVKWQGSDYLYNFFSFAIKWPTLCRYLLAVLLL